jgi:hypothetical protein
MTRSPLPARPLRGAATFAGDRGRCEKCGKRIEVCDLCEDPECKHVICHDCLSVALDERKRQPHEHGG